MSKITENLPAILFVIGSLCFLIGNAILVYRANDVTMLLDEALRKAKA